MFPMKLYGGNNPNSPPDFMNALERDLQSFHIAALLINNLEHL